MLSVKESTVKRALPINRPQLNQAQLNKGRSEFQCGFRRCMFHRRQFANETQIRRPNTIDRSKMENKENEPNCYTCRIP